MTTINLCLHKMSLAKRLKLAFMIVFQRAGQIVGCKLTGVK